MYSVNLLADIDMIFQTRFVLGYDNGHEFQGHYKNAANRKQDCTVFIQNEYHQVSLEPDFLVLSSDRSEERIPFNVWSGKIKLRRGLFWGGLQFYAHTENGKEQSWLVQGLDWEKCRDFARHAIASYQKWHHHQCEQLNQYLPKWESTVQGFVRQPAFLTHSKVESWLVELEQDFQKWKWIWKMRNCECQNACKS